MNTIILNTIGTPCKARGGGNSGGGGNTPSAPKWTGHADAEGLKAIGWTDEDIAYYQEHGVNWNAEDDEYHKVTDDNKALYGVLTADNIQDYKHRIAYLPKIDTSEVTDMSYMFSFCYALVAMPMLDTSAVVNMTSVFDGCASLSCIPLFDTSKVTNMRAAFQGCYVLENLPMLDTSNVTDMGGMFNICYSLKNIPPINTSKVVHFDQFANSCYSLENAPNIKTALATDCSSIYSYCSNLRNIPTMDVINVENDIELWEMSKLKHLQLDNLSVNCVIGSCMISKDSILYIINHEAAKDTIVITLSATSYNLLKDDNDIISSLLAHPLVSLANYYE
mgnify:CR=1 FL=1